MGTVLGSASLGRVARAASGWLHDDGREAVAASGWSLLAATDVMAAGESLVVAGALGLA